MGFVSFYTETWFIHWDHRIKDTNTLDVDEYYYLLNSFVVRFHYNKGGYQHGYGKEDTEERAEERTL